MSPTDRVNELPRVVRWALGAAPPLLPFAARDEHARPLAAACRRAADAIPRPVDPARGARRAGGVYAPARAWPRRGWTEPWTRPKEPQGRCPGPLPGGEGRGEGADRNRPGSPHPIPLPAGEGTPSPPYRFSWNVRAITSSCWARVRRWKFTA